MVSRREGSTPGPESVTTSRASPWADVSTFTVDPLGDIAIALRSKLLSTWKRLGAPRTIFARQLESWLTKTTTPRRKASRSTPVTTSRTIASSSASWSRDPNRHRSHAGRGVARASRATRRCRPRGAPIPRGELFARALEPSQHDREGIGDFVQGARQIAIGARQIARGGAASSSIGGSRSRDTPPRLPFSFRQSRRETREIQA